MRVLTRVGIGANLIDHAAGVPLARRASRPGLDPQPSFPPPVYRPPESGPIPIAVHPKFRDDAPVVLPMRRTWTLLLLVIALVLIPVGICASLVLSSRAPKSPLPPQPRSDIVSPVVSPTPAPPVATSSAPSERSSASPKAKPSEDVKRRVHSKAKPRPEATPAVSKRAPKTETLAARPGR